MEDVPTKILLIDDDEMMLLSLMHVLKKNGYEVMLAANSSEGVQAYESFKPDLVVTDLMMPVTSGLEVIKKIRLDLKEETPIIIISSMGQDKTVMLGFEMGVNDFITKPFKPTEVLERIRKILSKTWH